MQDKIWFILENEIVAGPFTPYDIEKKIESKNKSDLFFWGKGHTDWMSFDRWQSRIKELETQSYQYKQQVERMWKIKSDPASEEIIANHNQMIQYLKTLKDLSKVRIWTEGYSDWKEVFQIHKIMDELGVSRRAHPRVPIMGSVQIESGTDKEPLQARILTISEGGIGASGCVGFNIGEKVKLIIKSPNLYAPVHATAEVVFLGSAEYAGFKFSGLATESKSAIVEYVRKFSEQSSN